MATCVKKQLLVYLFLFTTYHLSAQKEGCNWYFGENAGLSFCTGTPVALTDGALSTLEGVATISDHSGNLLFYTDGMTVYDALHNIMPNGTGLLGHPSSTQSGIIVKAPGSSDLYYIFAMGSNHGSLTGLTYSIVDMTLNGGLGEVTVKNILVHQYTSERVTAVVHANGQDYWILINTHYGGDIYAYLLTSSGLSSAPVVSNVGIPSDIGYIKANYQRDRIAVANYHYNAGSFFLLDFDNATGILSNKIAIGATLPVSFGIAYGVEFSPDGTKFYGTTMDAPYKVLQYDLQAGSATDIANSGIIIATHPTKHDCSWGYYYGAIQLGPDGRIYVVAECDSFLNVINYPNERGVACGYVPRSVSLSGRIGRVGLPNFTSDYAFFPPSVTVHNDTICHGGHYVLPSGNTVYNTAIYYDTFARAGNSDSVIVTHLFVRNPSAVTVYDTICNDRLPVLWNGITVYAGGATAAHDTTHNAHGCDSITTFHLTVYATDSTAIKDSVCAGNLPYYFMGRSIHSGGTYYEVLKNIRHCDSVISLSLQVLPYIVTTVYDTICFGSGYALPSNNTVYAAGVYYDTLSVQNRCDSVVMIHLFIRNPAESEIYDTVCSNSLPYIWNGINIYTMGVVSYTTQNIYGCDSNTILDLTVFPSDTVMLSDSICTGALPYNFYGTLLHTSGLYHHVFPAVMGCDSVVTLMFTALPEYHDTVRMEICQGDSVTFYDSVYRSSGSYMHHYSTASRCDSVKVLLLHVNPIPGAPLIDLPDYVCQGESGVVRGMMEGMEHAAYSWTYNGVPLDMPLTFNMVWDTPGWKKYGLYVTDKGCHSPLTEDSINVIRPPAARQIVTSRVSVCRGDMITLHVKEPEAQDRYQYTWLPEDYFPDELTSEGVNVTASVYASGWIWLNTTDSNNCSIRDSIFIDGEACCDLMMHNAFSPNGDGLNDRFYPNLAPGQTIKEFAVYNRYGERVFASSTQKNGWDGMHKGLPADVGVYHYYLRFTCSDDTVHMKKGEVYLLR